MREPVDQEEEGAEEEHAGGAGEAAAGAAAAVAAGVLFHACILPLGGLGCGVMMPEGLQLVIGIVSLVLAILWIIVPFAIFAINDKARKAVKLLEEIRDLERAAASRERNRDRV